MRSVRFRFLVLFLGAVGLALAQSSVPTVSQPLPAQTLSPGGDSVTIDLRNYFVVPGLAGSQFAQFDTVYGRFNVELRNDIAPRHTTNFLAYAQANRYSNTFIHRTASFDNGAISIVQGGGYAFQLPFSVSAVEKFAPVALEYNLANARGTLAAARTSDVNSATSEWFINTRDNTTILNQSNGGGYTVFGRVMGTGMSVVDQIATTPRYSFQSPFSELPLRNYISGDPNASNLVVVNSVRPVSLFPTGAGGSVVELFVDNSAPSIVSHVLSGSTLTMTPLAPGNATLTVRAVDTNGNAATGSFTVSVAGSAPVLSAQPASQTIAAGSTVVFSAPAVGAASYRWERNGVELPGATSSTLVISNASAANAGTYVAIVANGMGTVRSNPATLTVAALNAVDTGRLVNLSILTSAGAGAKVLTMGAVVGPVNGPGALPLVIRAVGPTLGNPPFNVPGVLGDPVMTFYAAGNSTPLESNDNWGGATALSAAFTSVGAFALPTGSLDSAIVRSAPGVTTGGYTVQVTGKGGASGNVIAEIYDAASTSRTVTTPRLINVSTLTQIDAGAELAVGFVLGGQSARTVLVRGVGPSLGVAPFNISGVMADPRLELYNNNTGQKIAVNDNWGGEVEIATASAAVGAFALSGGASKDSVLLVTLPPGAYSARVSGVGGAGGTAIVEVYEVQ